jgi:hypothetical protein
MQMDEAGEICREEAIVGTATLAIAPSSTSGTTVATMASAAK